jgi:hypothetical protein
MEGYVTALAASAPGPRRTLTNSCSVVSSLIISARFRRTSRCLRFWRSLFLNVNKCLTTKSAPRKFNHQLLNLDNVAIIRYIHFKCNMAADATLESIRKMAVCDQQFWHAPLHDL